MRTGQWRFNSSAPVASIGAERTLLELATFLRDQDWDSRIVVLEGGGAAEMQRRAAEYGIVCETYVTTGRLGLWPMVRKLRATLARETHAVVHSHGYKPDILLAALGVPAAAVRRHVSLLVQHDSEAQDPRVPRQAGGAAI